MRNADVYRPNSNLLFAAFGVVMSALFIWSSFYQGGATSIATSICVAGVVMTCIYTFLFRPKVTFYDEGLVITNPLEKITVGWGDVVDLDSRWALTIATKEFTVSAWAATAPGRHHARNIHVNDIKGLDVDLGGSMRSNESPRSDSGASIYRARVRIARFQNNPGSQSLDSKREREIAPLVVGAILVIAAVLINTLGH
jgi:hypothetical protein